MLKKIGTIFLSIIILFSTIILIPQTAQPVQAAASARIHYITLPAETAAILLECNGKFGMVDSGEDSDYPNGTNPRYPRRPGTVEDPGFENYVIDYLKSAGVTQKNFEFYIGTHPHSDHIGSADEIIREFHPKRVYIQEYKDSYISNNSNLWDNLYIYDNMLAAAQEVGATIIQDFDPSAPLYPEKVSLQGIVVWDDEENQDNIRPSQVTITITNPHTHTSEEKVVQPDSAGKWSYQFDQLQKYDDSKIPIAYKASLKAPNGYTVTTNDNYNFTCFHSPTTSDEVITVIWDDAAAPENSRPLSLKVDLQKQISKGEDSEDADNSTENTDDDIENENIIWETIQSINLIPDETGAWKHTLEQLPNISESGSPIQYRLQINESDKNYSFTFSDIFTINASYIGTETLSKSGLQDMLPESILSDGISDGMITDSIPYSDRVDSTNTADPTNLRSSSAVPAQKGMFETLKETQPTISTPNFTLGESMRIEIKHYGGDYKTHPKPDANYFSLGVKITANNKTAFLAGDINNYEGAETALAKDLGHIDILTLGHHGFYGSNTYTYVTSLSPSVMVLPGTFLGVSNDTSSSAEYSTLKTLLHMGEQGIPLYATGWYYADVSALIFNFDSQLSNNIPKGKRVLGLASSTSTSTCEGINYYDGIPTVHTGWSSFLNYYCYFNRSKFAVKNRWILDTSGLYYYLTPDGIMATGWVNYKGRYYYMNDSGAMETGWVKVDGFWYYLDSNGAMLTGKQLINGSEYFFFSSGEMVASAWVGKHYYGSDGKWIPNYTNTNWKKNDIGWWYQHPDGTWPKNQWEWIDGIWYYFDNNGYMMTGWIYEGGGWYYLNSDGSMRIGWFLQNGKYYYLNSNGKMAVGWQYINGSWYYMNPSGLMQTGWQYIQNDWYYMDSQGRMNTGWLHTNGIWYYLQSNGAMAHGWQYINNSWYYLNSDGSRLGQGWHWIGTSCYYIYSSGIMAANTWINGYYVDSLGAWIPEFSQKAQWLNNGGRWWYRHADGSYTRSNWEKINGKWYLFDNSGWMLTGWQKVHDTWHYLNSNGDMLEQGWHWINGKCYYMNASGAMASNTRIDGYYVDDSGAWIPGV